MENTAFTARTYENIRSFVERSVVNRFWDWPAFAFTILLVQISSARLTITEWAPFLYFTQTIGLISTVTGLLLGYSTFERRKAFRMGFVYMVFVLSAHWLNAIDRSGILWLDMLALTERLFTSLLLFLRNQPVYDPLFFVAITSIGFWSIGLWAGYQMARHKDFLDAVLPAGLVMLIIQLFDPGRNAAIWGLAFYIFVSLLLMGRLYFVDNQKTWKVQRAHITPEVSKDLANGVFLTALIVVMVAWSIPNLIAGIKPAAKAWNDLTRPLFERLSDATRALESDYGNGPGDLYGPQLALGDRAATGESAVFYVQVKESDFIPLRFYWRARVYDLYTNGRWTNASISSEEFLPASDRRGIEFPDARHEMEFVFTNNLETQSLMYMPSEAVWVSRNSSLQTIPHSSARQDMAAWLAIPALSQGDTYSVRSMMADPTMEDLRAAGTEYPDWTTKNYLEVPENLKPRLRELAEQITVSAETPYDKAEAITSYLRNEIQYEAELTQTPPDNADPVLWVLFEYKKGFCMYYASAEVLMLRSLGIPARMAVGFTEGAIDEEENTYTVTHENAHAWPEVYFPGIGWVEFEPTGNQLPLTRPETDLVFSEESGNPATGGQLQDDFILEPEKDQGLPEDTTPKPIAAKSISSLGKNTYNPYIRYAWVALALVVIGLMVFATRKKVWTERLPLYLAGRWTQGGINTPRWLTLWTRWARLSPVEKTFQMVNLSLYWLGHPQPKHITSAERAGKLAKYLPAAKEDIAQLLNEYETEVYTPGKPRLETARKAAFRILAKTWQSRILEVFDFQNRRYNQLQ